MKTKPTDLRRRQVLKTALISAAALPFVPLSGQAQEKLPESDPAAQALGYKHDASQVDAGRYPRRAGAEGAKQFCHNCQLFAGPGEEEWGTCSIFPGKLVNRNGWCNAWTPKTG